MGLTDKITAYFIHKVDKSLDLEKINQIVFISFTAIISIFFYLVFGTFALINERYLLALILGIVSAVNYFIYQYLYRSYKLTLCANAIVAVTAALFLYLLITGGTIGKNVYGTGFLWVYPFPVLAVAIKGLRKGTIISAVFLMLMVIVFIINLYITSLPDYDLGLSLRIICSYLAVHLIIYIFEFMRLYNKQKMDKWISESRNESRLKDDFLSKLSHQIRTPLNNITLISNLVDRSQLHSDQQDLFDTIIASTNNLVNVVNNIVQISAIDVEEKEQSLVSFNIKSTIENTLKLFKNQHKEKLDIDFNVETPKLQYIDNPVRIKQLFLNLIENIVKVNFSEMIRLSVTLTAEPVDDEFSIIIVEIVCPGLNLKQDNKNNYYVIPSDPPTTGQDLEKYHLDFNIAHRIIQLHGGSLNINSEDNTSSFSFNLQLKRDEKLTLKTQEEIIEKPSQIIPTKTRQLEDANVLLVEDNSINQKIVILSLKNKVKNIDVANNGKEALDHFGTTRYDIILMDIQMPVMNGIIATKKIRELEESTNTHTPIIAITANALTGDKEACLAAGMNEYISKPFQVEVLLQKMRNLLTLQPT